MPALGAVLVRRQDAPIGNPCGTCCGTNDSEYIRDLIRREQERGAGIEATRAALIQDDKEREAEALRRERIQAQASPHAWLNIGSPPPQTAIWREFGMHAR